jgi:hypothetical protein
MHKTFRTLLVLKAKFIEICTAVKVQYLKKLELSFCGGLSGSSGYFSQQKKIVKIEFKANPEIMAIFIL